LSRNSTQGGKQIDFNNAHSENANNSIRVSFAPDSKVNDKTSSNLTEAGRQIDFNATQFANDSVTISYSSDLNSKAIQRNANLTDFNEGNDREPLAKQIRRIMCGRTKLLTIETEEIETDNSVTCNILPSK
jgi:hypothetical protein